jgi:hypothetical protein
VDDGPGVSVAVGGTGVFVAVGEGPGVLVAVGEAGVPVAVAVGGVGVFVAVPQSTRLKAYCVPFVVPGALHDTCV